MPEQQRRRVPTPTVVAAARHARAAAQDEQQRAVTLRRASRRACDRSATLVHELTCADHGEATAIFLASLEPLARLAGDLDERRTRAARLLAPGRTT
jgi:hypothetical protein